MLLQQFFGQSGEGAHSTGNYCWSNQKEALSHVVIIDQSNCEHITIAIYVTCINGEIPNDWALLPYMRALIYKVTHEFVTPKNQPITRRVLAY